MVEIVAIERADIKETQFLEQRAARPETSREFLGELRLLIEELRQAGRDKLAESP